MGGLDKKDFLARVEKYQLRPVYQHEDGPAELSEVIVKNDENSKRGCSVWIRIKTRENRILLFISPVKSRDFRDYFGDYSGTTLGKRR